MNQYKILAAALLITILSPSLYAEGSGSTGGTYGTGGNTSKKVYPDSPSSSNGSGSTGGTYGTGGNTSKKVDPNSGTTNEITNNTTDSSNASNNSNTSKIQKDNENENSSN